MINENKTVTETTQDTIYEDEHGNVVRRSETTVIYEADILKVDQPTTTGWIYPREVMERALAAYQHAINAGQALGTVEPGEELYTALNKVSHIVNRVELQGNAVRAVVQTLQTPAGKQLAEALKQGRVDLIPIGYGSHHDGRVSDNYTIRSFDFVMTPAKEPST